MLSRKQLFPNQLSRKLLLRALVFFFPPSEKKKTPTNYVKWMPFVLMSVSSCTKIVLPMKDCKQHLKILM